MKKKKLQRGWILAFVLVLYGIPLLWIVFGGRGEIETYENRVTTKLPVWKVQDGWEAFKAYPSAFEAYYNDHLPFRNEWIDLHSRIEYGIFQSSPNREVAAGKDGWLFYNNTLDDNSIEAYKGNDLFTEAELGRIMANLLEGREKLKKNGVTEFVLFLAPNKERIYAEKMPDYYGAPASYYRTWQLITYLRENTDLRIVYPYEELLEAKEKISPKPIYYRLDTHWNEIGGYIGSLALLKELGVELTPLGDLTITETAPTICDLADMIHMREYLNTDADYVLSGYDSYGMQMEKHDLLGEYVYRCENGDERVLFMLRDSFADAMDDYVASRFSRSCMVHYSGNYQEALQREQPDIFVYELVERRIGSLLDFPDFG